MRGGLWAKENFTTNGEHVVPINPDHRALLVKRIGPYIGGLEDAVNELTGKTPKYVPKISRKIGILEEQLTNG